MYCEKTEGICSIQENYQNLPGTSCIQFEDLNH